jgi:hypothetical protein
MRTWTGAVVLCASSSQEEVGWSLLDASICPVWFHFVFTIALRSRPYRSHFWMKLRERLTFPGPPKLFPQRGDLNSVHIPQDQAPSTTFHLGHQAVISIPLSATQVLPS